jgi:hypothetical protein
MFRVLFFFAYKGHLHAAVKSAFDWSHVGVPMSDRSYLVGSAAAFTHGTAFGPGVTP